MKTRRIIEGCPELGYYDYKIYVAPESYCEERALERRREYYEVQSKDRIEEKLADGLQYELYIKSEQVWNKTAPFAKGSLIPGDSGNVQIDYYGAPLQPFSRVLYSDGEDVSQITFRLYLEVVGLKNHEIRYAAKRKSSFSQ